MDDSRKNSVVEQLTTRVEQLIARYNAANERNNEIEKLLANEQERSAVLQNRVDELQKELTFAQMATCISGDEQGEESKRAKSYINRLLREVDECIALVATPLEVRE